MSVYTCIYKWELRVSLLHCFPCQVCSCLLTGHTYPVPINIAIASSYALHAPFSRFVFLVWLSPHLWGKPDLRLANPCSTTQPVAVVVSVFPSLLYLRCVIFWGKEPSSRYLINYLFVVLGSLRSCLFAWARSLASAIAFHSPRTSPIFRGRWSLIGLP